MKNFPNACVVIALGGHAVSKAGVLTRWKTPMLRELRISDSEGVFS